MIHGSFPRSANPVAESASGAEIFGAVRIWTDAWLDERDALAGRLGIEAGGVSDAGLIAAAWSRWGEDCCEHLLGDFAFALWDGGQRKLMLARDPVGARPLRFCVTGERVFFSSGIEWLLACPEIPKRLDEQMLAARFVHPLGFLRILNERTYWKDIQQLPGGERLVVSGAAVRRERWRRWENAPDVRFRRSEDYAEALSERLERAVARCLVRSDKVASHISGGMDCSTIAAIATRQLGRRGRKLTAAYTWFSPPDSLSPDGDDAFRTVEKLAHELEAPLHCVLPSAESLMVLAASDFTRCPVTMLEYEDEVLRHAQSSGVKVILSGWGGDEVVTVRQWAGWFDLLHHGRWRDAWREFHLGARPAASFPLAVAAWMARGVLHQAIPYRRRPPSLYGNMPFIDRDRSRRILAEADFAPFTPHPARGLKARCLSNLTSGQLAFRMESWALAGAGRGIRYRYPLLDRELVELCLGMPPELTIQGGAQRSLFRRAIRGTVPEEIRLQEKPKELQRVARLGAANDAATELLAQKALSVPVAPLFDWIDYGVLDRALSKPASDPATRFVRRQAARIRLLSAGWQNYL